MWDSPRVKWQWDSNKTSATKKVIKWDKAFDFQQYKKFDQEVCVIAEGHGRIKNIKLEKLVKKIYREEEIKFRLRHREH